MKVFDLTYVEYPDTFSGLILACFSLLPIFIVFSLLPVALISRKLSPLFLLLGVVISTAINAILKRLIRQPRPNSSHRDGFGMPSDHSQLCAFWTAYFFIVLLANPRINKSFFFIATSLNFFSAIAVMYSRVFLGVHTPAQVFVGACVGSVLGSLWGVLYVKQYNTKLMKLENKFSKYIDKIVYIGKSE